jgi:hypothetical protein
MGGQMKSKASDRGTTERPSAYVEGTLAVGPGIAMYVGEGFSLHARRAGTPFLAVAVDGTFAWADPVGEARMAEGRAVCLPSGRECRLEAQARRVAILYVNGHSSPGRVLARLAVPGRLPDLMVLGTVPSPAERPEAMRHAAVAWLRALGAGEIEALHEPAVIAGLRAYEEERRRGGPRLRYPYTRVTRMALDRVGIGSAAAAQWQQVGCVLRMEAENPGAGVATFSSPTVRAARRVLAWDWGFGPLWPRRIVSLVEE